MKNFRRALTIMLCLTLCVLVVACGNDDNKGGGGADKTEYNITAEESAYYTVSLSAAKAVKDTLIEINLTDIADNIEIVAVEYNGKSCQKTEEGKYTFTMPAENVAITVKTRVLEAVTEDGIAIFDDKNLTTVAKGGTFNAPSIIDKNMWCFDIIFDTLHMTILESEITSSDNNVVPADAIEVRKVEEDDSTIIAGAKVIIDTAKINVGTAWLTMYFKNGNISGAANEGTLLIPVTIVEYGELQLPVMNETVILDLASISPYEGQQFTVRIADYDYVDGSCNFQREDYVLTCANGELTVTFDYTAGHDYWIRISYGAEDNYQTTLTVKDGYTSAGGELKGGWLRFEKPDVILELDVEEQA